MEKQKFKVRRLSIRQKIIIPISFVLLIVCVLLGANGYRQVYYGMLEMGMEEAEVATDVAKLAHDAIIAGARPIERYTNTIVSVHFKICSSTCELLVAFIFFIPVKYPLITEDTQTKNSDGASARITY